MTEGYTTGSVMLIIHIDILNPNVYSSNCYRTNSEEQIKWFGFVKV